MTDRFASTAGDYARYRPGYPPEVLDRLRSAYRLDGSGRLLDLGCGTGEVARALHSDFESVVAIDVSPEMLAEGRRQAELLGITNIDFVELAAERISAELGAFRLVTAGSAFHWMDQDEVLERAYPMIEPGGGFVLLAAPLGTFNEDTALELVTRAVVERWTGRWHDRRVGIQAEPNGAEKRSLARSRFVDVEVGRHAWEREVDVDAIVGQLFSTSFASRAVLGDRAGAFEADLRGALPALHADGRFIQRLETEWVFAFKPA